MAKSFLRDWGTGKTGKTYKRRMSRGVGLRDGLGEGGDESCEEDGQGGGELHFREG